MRHHVFLAVLLSLVVSLSKGSTTGSDTSVMTAPTTPEISTGSDTAVTTAPTTPGNSTGSDTAVTTAPTAPGDLCGLHPCGEKSATCVALNSTFTCQCPYGFYYSNQDCHKGKIFPGVITLNEAYSDSLQTVNSMQYEEVFQNITTFFNQAFSELPGFAQTVIVQIQPLEKVRASFPVSVTVINLFMENATVESEEVNSAVQNASKESSYVSDYREINTGSDTAVTTAPTTPGSTTESDTSVTTAPTAPEISTGSDTAVTTAPTTPGSTTESDTSVTTAPTAPGNSTGSDTAVTTAPTTPGDLCGLHPCGEKSATCVALNSTFTCQCPYGFYYSNQDCHKGKIFPGVITLNEAYSDSLQTVNSMQYEEVFQNITTFFNQAFSELPGFAQTVIVQIQPLEKVRASFPVSVTVINLFMENAAVKREDVTSAVQNASKGSSYVSDYRAATYCEAFNCDTQTTDCVEKTFPECKCKTGFSSTQWDVRSCSDCSKDCSEEENKYCVKEKGVPTCKCKSNFESKNGNCVSCPVGYSGENCNNNRELILIIVGTVFGAIILSLVIALSVVSVRAKHKGDPEKKRLIKSGYSNPNTSDDRQTTMFPRVQTTSGHANPGYQPNNPYEMHSANRGRFPERDYDDMYEISREPEGFRMQSRY